MRALTVASILVLGSLTMFACNDGSTGDDGEGTGGSGADTGSGSTSGSGSSSGSGAASGTGASTGTGGDTGACSEGEFGTAVAAGTCNTINDFEGADFTASFGLESDGRQGAGIDMDGDAPRLSGGADESGTGTLEVTDDAAAGDAAIKFTFSGAKEWGGAFSHLLSNGPCYDASAYEGITFQAKATSDAKEIYVMISTADSNPLYDCTDADEAAGLCYDHPRKKITLTDSYAEYTIPWADLDPPGWGATDAFEVSRTLAVVFADAGADPDDNSIEFFIDELAFTGGDASACAEADGGMGGATN